MEEFIDNIKNLINTLGHKIYEVKRALKSPPQQAVETFYIKAARCADGQGEPTSYGFVVFKGSKVADSTVSSITQFLNRLRDELIESGLIIQTDREYELSEDHILSSPSTAAVIVLGHNANGLTVWKLKDGTTLKEFESGKKYIITHQRNLLYLRYCRKTFK